MSAWRNPLPLSLVPTRDALSFASLPSDQTGLPLHPHPGAFGFVRKHHTHEGVDLYAPEGTPVCAVEDGVVVRIEPFTGPSAQSPWWQDTDAVFVEGSSGVVVYGEIVPRGDLKEGMILQAGDMVGAVKAVLREDKGRPSAMLHLELHDKGARQAPAWEHARPSTLLDPTDYLLDCVVR